ATLSIQTSTGRSSDTRTCTVTGDAATIAPAAGASISITGGPPSTSQVAVVVAVHPTRSTASTATAVRPVADRIRGPLTAVIASASQRQRIDVTPAGASAAAAATEAPGGSQASPPTRTAAGDVDSTIVGGCASTTTVTARTVSTWSSASTLHHSTVWSPS